ncbi:MAG: DNA gyrase inhibitor YacG, partial [Rubripirellula sp.]|nr:DNA gyrase inhibitor YacG [Rubripirellula sp.]
TRLTSPLSAFFNSPRKTPEVECGQVECGQGISFNESHGRSRQPMNRLVATLSKPTRVGKNTGMKPAKTSKPSAENVRVTCSVCGSRFYFDETTAPPFCSPRCKAIDLNRWLDEEISLPHEGGPKMGEVVELDEGDD